MISNNISKVRPNPASIDASRTPKPAKGRAPFVNRPAPSPSKTPATPTTSVRPPSPSSGGNIPAAVKRNINQRLTAESMKAAARRKLNKQQANMAAVKKVAGK